MALTLSSAFSILSAQALALEAAAEGKMPAEIPCAIDQEAGRLDGGFEAFEGCNEGLQVAGGSRREITDYREVFQ